MFLGIPKLINLLESPESFGVRLAGCPEGRAFVPLGFQGLPEFGHRGSGLAAILDGGGHRPGTPEGLNQLLNARAAVAVNALNPRKPHLYDDLYGAYGSEGRNQ